MKIHLPRLRLGSMGKTSFQIGQVSLYQKGGFGRVLCGAKKVKDPHQGLLIRSRQIPYLRV
jgi:hypothetical protein